MKHNAYLPKNISGSIFSLVKSTIFLICSFKLIFVQLFFWMIFKIFTHLFFWRKLNFRSCALLCMNMRVIVEYGIECAISYPFFIFFFRTNDRNLILGSQMYKFGIALRTTDCRYDQENGIDLTMYR